MFSAFSVCVAQEVKQKELKDLVVQDYQFSNSKNEGFNKNFIITGVLKEQERYIIKCLLIQVKFCLMLK